MVKSNKPDSDKKPIPPAATRREPLPSQLPKHPAEDPDAPARIKAILDNPSSRRPDLDLDFLAQDPEENGRRKCRLHGGDAGLRIPARPFRR